MKFYSGAHTYRFEGGHSTISPVGEWLEAGAPALGTLDAVYLTAFFRHAPPRAPNARHADFEKRLRALPKVTRARKGREVSLAFAVDDVSGEAVDELRSKRDVGLFCLVAERALAELARVLPTVVKVDERHVAAFLRAKQRQLPRKEKSLEGFIARLRATRAAASDKLREVLVETWSRALLELGFARRGSSFRRTTVRGIEVVRIERAPFFQVNLYVAPPSAAKGTDAALATRVAQRHARAWMSGEDDRTVATLANLLYVDEIVPPTEVAARALAARQVRAARGGGLRPVAKAPTRASAKRGSKRAVGALSAGASPSRAR